MRIELAKLHKFLSYFTGCSLVSFTFGYVLSYYFEFGFDLMLLGGISTSLGLISLMVRLKLSDINTTLLYFSGMSLILHLTLYSFDYPYEKELKMVSLISLALVYLRERIKGGNMFSVALYLDHPMFHFRIVYGIFGLVMIAVFLKIMHVEYIEYVYQLLSIFVAVWAYLYFIRGKDLHVPLGNSNLFE